MQEASTRTITAADPAELFAALRASGAAERDLAIRHPDALAADLLPWAPLTTLAKIPAARRAFAWVCARASPGVYFYELARGRVMDEILVACLHDALDQLVIPGAGMDSRAYRFADVLARVAIFELDHPVSAERKRQAIRRQFGQLPSRIHYVEADLDMHRIARVLRRHGFREHLRTLFIWSGVSGYLTTDAVDAVLQDVASLRKASIVFDYWHAAVACGELDAYGARQAATRAANLGEPYRSGIEPDHLAQHLAARGLHLVDDIGPRQLRERYLTRSDGRTHGRPYEFLSIAHAASSPTT